MLKIAQPPVTNDILLKGKPFSLADLDLTLPLIKILDMIRDAVDRSLLFDLRLDHCLVALRSEQTSDANKIVAAFLCHYPYRSVIQDPACHPFRIPLLELLDKEKNLSSPVAAFISSLISGSDEQVDRISHQSPLRFIEEHNSGLREATPTRREVLLVKKAIEQTLSMAEQRHLLSALASNDEEVWLTPLLQPQDLLRSGANNPMITCEMVGRLCQEALGSRDTTQKVQECFVALQELPPNLRSFDLVTRLLRSDRVAPAPAASHGRDAVPLTTTVAHLAHSSTLGGFLAHSIRTLERLESDKESLILSESAQSGLPAPSRREIEELLEDRMARPVSIFCHFVRSLVNAALLFPPDLGRLRRQGAEAEVRAMEQEMQEGAQAMLIELKHFALRFGRYRDGMRLYGELTSLS